MARLERLSQPARRVVSIASLVGRDSDFRLLQHAAGLSDRDAAEVIEELVRRRVFRAVGERLDFTHDRLREFASQALLPAQRTPFHRVIATSMEQVYAGEFERHYPALAAHCREGELWEKAVTYLAEAGTRAAERSAYREAATSFQQALEALARLPESRRTLEQAVDLRLALHTSWYAVAELERAHQALSDAQEPARRLGDPRRSALLALQTGQSLWVRGHAREALPLFEHVAAEAKTLDDSALLTSATLYIASARFSLGDLMAAEDGFRRVIGALGDAAGEKLGLHGLPLVFAQSGLTALLAEHGRFHEAGDYGTTSIRVAEALNHPYMLVFALRTLAYAYLVEGRSTDSVAVLERAHTLCDDASTVSLAPNIMASLGHAYSVTGRTREGTVLLEQALTTLERYSHHVWTAVVMTQLAEACLLDGDVVRARETAERARSLASERGERGFEAWALRLCAVALSRGAAPDVGAAREYYRAALALAEERAMRPLTAHCHAGLSVVEGLLGDPARAADHRAAALEICRTIGMATPSELALADESRI
jgi:tetratricopeptide (TPR) repeat protein